ncbi:MAG: hypothetical protein ACRDLO_05370 [Solirubrobacterales bacterium]
MGRRRRISIRAASIAVLASLALAPAAFAAAFEVAQVDSADPVAEGAAVTYTITVTNTLSSTEELWLGTLVTKIDSDASVPNPYLSIESTQGSCAIDPPSSFGYAGASCALGPVAGGASVGVRGVVQANFSMRHLATVFNCDPSFGSCFPFFSSGEPTTVIHAPTLSGSEKIRVRGLPASCATTDFKAKAKAKAPGVRSMTATLSGPRNEFGSPLEGSGFSDRIAKKQGRRVKANVRAARLRDGFWELTFLALRKGAPNLKRTATFQAC